MSQSSHKQTPTIKATETTAQEAVPLRLPPIPNYTLSTVCPGCGSEMFRLACKVRCKHCGFMWDCSEL